MSPDDLDNPLNRTIILGSRCKDSGACHHRCAPPQGCFRQSCCGPLRCSGLDDLWRSPEEAARDEALILAQSARSAPASKPAPSL